MGALQGGPSIERLANKTATMMNALQGGHSVAHLEPIQVLDVTCPDPSKMPHLCILANMSHVRNIAKMSLINPC